MHFADVIFLTRDPQVYGHLLTLMHLKCTKQEENAVRYESCMQMSIHMNYGLRQNESQILEDGKELEKYGDTCN